MLSKRLTIRTFALALALSSPLHAAELGELKVNSHIGQQLSADIELVDLTAADLAELHARLANPDVFKVAGLEMPPELGGLYISVAKRDNRRFLHLTTLQPVRAEALHLFLEMNAGGRQVIRAASLWLTPEPPAQRAARMAEAQVAPVPAPVPAMAPAAAPPPMPAATTALIPTVTPKVSGETGMNEAAQRAFAYRRQKALEQAQARAAGQESMPAVTSAPAANTAVPNRSTAAGVLPPAVSARHAPVQSQSCAPAKQVEAQLEQCQAMTSKLADIEGRVRHLQAAIAAPAPAAAAKQAAAPAPTPAPTIEAAAAKPASAPAKPATAPAKPGATPVKPGVAADLAGNSRMKLIMIVVGSLVGLSALGATIFILRRRQSQGPLKIWQSFRKKDAEGVSEPVLEEAEQVAAQ